MTLILERVEKLVVIEYSINRYLGYQDFYLQVILILKIVVSTLCILNFKSWSDLIRKEAVIAQPLSNRIQQHVHQLLYEVSQFFLLVLYATAIAAIFVCRRSYISLFRT